MTEKGQVFTEINGRFQRFLAWILPATLVGVPLIIAPGFCFFFDITPKVVVLLLGTAVALLMPGAYIAGLTRLRRDPLARWFLVLLAAQAVSLAVSTAFSAEPELSLSGSNWRRLGLLTHVTLLAFAVVLAGWVVGERRRFLGVFRAVTVSGGVLALYGVLQYFALDPLLPAEAYHAGEGPFKIVRPPGTLGHAGYFATYLLHVVFFSLALVRVEVGRWWRTAGFAVALLASAAIVMSGTRSAILGLLVGGLVAGLWYRPTWNRRTIGGALVLLLGAVFFFISPAGERLRSRVYWITDETLGGGRLWLWRDSLRMASDYWVVGAGLETFSALYPRYTSVELARAYPNNYYESPHNVLLDAATAQGMAGVAIFVGMALVAGAAMLRLWKAKRGGQTSPAGRERQSGLMDDGGLNTCAGYVAAAFVAGLCSNQFLVFTAPTALYFYATLALLTVAAQMPESQAPTPKTARVKRGWVLAVPLAAVLAVFAAQLGWADWGFARVRRHLEQGQVSLAITTYERVGRVKPAGMNMDLWFSRALAQAAPAVPDLGTRILAESVSLEAATRAAEQAEDRHNACYNLAAFYGLRDDYEKTVAALHRTVEAAPNWYKPHWMLARIHQKAGLGEEARREAALAVELNGGKNPEVASTWEELRVGRK